MTTPSAMQRAIGRVLSGVPVNSSGLSTAGARYQVYIFALLVDALQQIGAAVTLRSRGYATSAPPNLLVRGAPGSLRSSTDYGFCAITYNGSEYELHIGIEYEGVSGMTHEIDVSILTKSEADRIRANTVGEPRASSNQAAIECKFYGSRLSKALAREFVGLTNDIGRRRVNFFVSNVTHPQFSLYFNPVRASRPVFRPGVVDSAPLAELAFVQDLAAELQGRL